MEALGQPGGKTRLGGRQIDGGHADLGESERAGPLPDTGHQPESIDLNHSSRHPPIVETSPSPLRLVWPDEAATQRFAERLAQQGGIANAFIALQGDLGAGKTTLVRHLLRALGATGRIKSPTYAVVEPHEIDTRQPPLAAWHFDFYRFNDPREWEDAGFRDIFASPGLKLAEWPDKAGALLPAPDLTLMIDTHADGTRHVTVTSGTAAGATLLQALAQQPSA
jgi:tRNA threonylcarbamoyladenosine biosynthesis protein TsaE